MIGISISDGANAGAATTITTTITTTASQYAAQPPQPAALTRNERKRRFREEQAARQAAATAADGGAPQKKQQRHPLRMPASAFLPLGAEVLQRRCVIAYDGSRFQGFQAQERGEAMRTVQETIEDALLRTTGETIRLRAASRTDAGVHAQGQVVAFVSKCTAEDRVFRDALNNRLPEDVLCRRMTRTDHRSGDNGPSLLLFDPRAHSKRKTYKYVIVNCGLRPVFDRNRTWFVKKPLDVTKMNAAIAFFLEEPTAKDYSSFTPQKAAAGDEHGNVCTITSIRIIDEPIKQDQSHLQIDTDDDTNDGPDATNLDASRKLEIVFQGDRFLYKMVRNLVGTLVDVGLGRIAPESIPLILQAKNRGKAGQGAPPQGLTLMHIEYE